MQTAKEADVMIRVQNSFRSRDAFRCDFTADASHLQTPACQDDFLIPETDLKILEDFLGEGATAKVFRGTVRGTQDVAVKVMQKGLSVDDEKQALADLHEVGVFPCYFSGLPSSPNRSFSICPAILAIFVSIETQLLVPGNRHRKEFAKTPKPAQLRGLVRDG
jgi:hypothetical protein